MTYVPGDFWRICDRTGFKVRASQTRKEWNGLIVREQSYEDRHPQDFVKGREDRQGVPDARPRPTDVFINTGASVAAWGDSWGESWGDAWGTASSGISPVTADDL